MSATSERDQVAKLAKSDPEKALEKARSIKEAWFRAQALSWIARYSPGKTVAIAKEVARAARTCDDAYKKTAARVWEIAALAEVGATGEAVTALNETLAESRNVIPMASRAEALILLLHAAARINLTQRERVHDELKQACGQDGHWRSKRALRDAAEITSGSRKARPFFW